MKRLFALVILMSVSVAFAADIGFQETTTNPAESVSGNHSAEQALKVLAIRLSLTEDQKAKILPLLVERRRKTEEVWNSSEQFVRQKQVQVRGINIEIDKRINALLTGDQQKAYAAFEQERKVKRRARQVQSESAAQ